MKYNPNKLSQPETNYQNRDKRQILTADYTQISNWILRCNDLTGEQKIIYSILKSFNPAFPSYKQLTLMTGWSRKKLIAINKSLRASGLIDWSHRYNNSNRYYIYDEPNEEVIKKCITVKQPSVSQRNSNNTKITLTTGDNNNTGCITVKQLETDSFNCVSLRNNSVNDPYNEDYE